MRVVVTGGCGFIGSHVVDRLLRERMDVLILDNMSRGRDHWLGRRLRPAIEKVDITECALTVEKIVQWRPDALIHLAAHHFIPFCAENPREAYRLNVGGTLNVIEALSRTMARQFFFASTADVYAPSDAAHKESDLVAPFTVYGHTKVLGEHLVHRLADFGWPGIAVVGRIFNAVGCRETNPHLVPEVITQIKSGARELMLGNLTPTRDFTDVASQADAIVDLTFRARQLDTVNIGSGAAIEVSAMVDLIREVSKQQLAISVDPRRVRPAERQHLCADTGHLRSLIGYAPAPARRETLQSIFAEGK